MARLSQDPAHLAPFIVTPFDATQARRVQTANITSDRPSQEEREIGNESLVGRTFDPPEITLNVEANLVNARLLSIFANRDPDDTFSDVTVQDLLGNADVDLMMVQRNTARTAWLQSVYVRQASVGSYAINASTDASATETFELAADNKTAFERFVQVDNLTASGSADDEYTLTQTPVALTRGQYAGKKLISAAMAQPDGPSTYLLEDDDFTVSGTTVTITNADILAEIVSGTQFSFAYQRSGGTTPDPFQAKDTISPAAIRGYYHIPVTITASGTGMNVRGMQSIEATMNFQQEKEVGMGNQAVGAFRVTPAEVTGNFVVFSENYTLEELMIAGETGSTDTDYPIEAYRNDLIIKIEFKHPATGTVLRTDVLSGCTIVGDGRDVSVGQAVGKQFNFAASDDFGWYVTKNV
jgi:hypothetical protein